MKGTPARPPQAESKASPADKPKTVIRMSASERAANRNRRGKAAHPPGMHELNPKLQSSRDILPRSEGQVPGGRPMSFAEKVRAEAEAAFQKIAPAWSPNEAEPEPEPAAPAPEVHRSQFQIRISEQDQLTVKLRMSEGRAAVAAAKELADKYQLPPDQSLLMKVITLRNTELTRLALEELLELDDRGRVRSNPELIAALQGIKSRDKEIRELRSLFLEKLGA